MLGEFVFFVEGLGDGVGSGREFFIFVSNDTLEGGEKRSVYISKGFFFYI